jgi:hypothetical protein
MLRNLLGRGKSAEKSSQGGSGHGDHSDRRGGKKAKQYDELVRKEKETEEAERRKGTIVKDTSVTSMKHKFSDEEESLASKLERHRSGSMFKYAVISTAPPKDRGSILSKVRTFKAKTDLIQTSLDDLPAINLKDNYTEFRLSQALGNTKLSSLLPYTTVTDVLVHYVPMDTFFATSHPLDIQINDFRKNEDTVARKYTLTDKGSYNILFCMDYSTLTTDLDDLSLSLSCNVTDFREGKAWASIKVVVRMTHSSFPQKFNLQETIGVTLWAHSDLEDYVTDPTTMDGTITGEALKLLKQSYQRGEIEDLVTPRDNKKQMNLARTVVGESGGRIAPDLLMDSMKENALLQERAKSASFGGVQEAGSAAFNPSRGGQIKSAMKKESPFARGRALMEEEGIQISRANSLKSVGPEDSQSVLSSHDSTEEIPPDPVRLSKLSNYDFKKI